MATPKRALIKAVLFTAALTLAGCGLGRDSGSDGEGGTDPIVAATVNGRPIYIEDVRGHAVARGWLRETEDLDANSDAFYLALEELIQMRLFAMEAEARGIDRRVDVRRQIDNARERVLAASIYDEIDARSNDPEAIERLYRENASRLGQGEEVHLRHIVFPTREAADQAKRRLDQGERFEVIAFEQNTSGDGGDLGFRAIADLTTAMRQEVYKASGTFSSYWTAAPSACKALRPCARASSIGCATRKSPSSKNASHATRASSVCVNLKKASSPAAK
jgi:hypothetical protein